MPQYLASTYEEKEQIKEALPTFKSFKTSKVSKLKFSTTNKVGQCKGGQEGHYSFHKSKDDKDDILISMQRRIGRKERGPQDSP